MKLLDDMQHIIEFSEMHGKECLRCVTVVTVYASPQALKKIKSHPLTKGIVVGVVADGVDNQGFLIPSTGGDMGDKLFGKDT